MAASFETYQKRRLRSSYISVVISISMVLFMVGIFGLLVINTKKGSDIIKEKVTLSLFLKNSASQESIKKLQKDLEKSTYTKSVSYINKSDAAKELADATGEDFVEFLGYNPLQNAINLRLKAAFVTTERVDSLATILKQISSVDDVNYDKPLIKMLTNNLSKISFWILVLSVFFTLISILIINSSIRLSIYSKRFTIKTMQMAGATKDFIRRPFILQSIKLGLIGAFIANFGLSISIYYINKNLPILNLLDDKFLLFLLYLGIFALSVFMSWISTFFAAQRFLNLRTNDIY
ncbi:MAG: cell division protein FtsX [Flavobacteriales bacterium CG_4_8_14_3_um_filter_35_10]|nr:MAG: cell division protein FtsX [Flavobacteriales bacterium CG_4_8_14_3_um_filter_35_10]